MTLIINPLKSPKLIQNTETSNSEENTDTWSAESHSHVAFSGGRRRWLVSWPSCRVWWPALAPPLRRRGRGGGVTAQAAGRSMTITSAHMQASSHAACMSSHRSVIFIIIIIIIINSTWSFIGVLDAWAPNDAAGGPLSCCNRFWHDTPDYTEQMFN